MIFGIKELSKKAEWIWHNQRTNRICVSSLTPKVHFEHSTCLFSCVMILMDFWRKRAKAYFACTLFYTNTRLLANHVRMSNSKIWNKTGFSLFCVIIAINITFAYSACFTVIRIPILQSFRYFNTIQTIPTLLYWKFDLFLLGYKRQTVHISIKQRTSRKCVCSYKPKARCENSTCLYSCAMLSMDFWHKSDK